MDPSPAEVALCGSEAPLLVTLLVACRPDAPPGGGVPCDEPGHVCTWLGVARTSGFSEEDRHRLDTLLSFPSDLAFGPDGAAFYPDVSNHRIRRVTADGVVATVSGTGMRGDGPPGQTCWDGCDAASTPWNAPFDVQVDPDHPAMLWVAGRMNNRIATVDLDQETVTWRAGDGTRGHADGPAVEAQLYWPSGVAVEGGWAWVADSGTHVVREISPETEVSTVAGTPWTGGYQGDGGWADDALLQLGGNGPSALGSKLLVRDREILVADTSNGVIRSVDLDSGIIVTVAGSYVPDGSGRSVPGYAGDGGPAREAILAGPTDVALGPDLELYVADTWNHCVRVVRDGVIETFAGVCTVSGFDGDGGPADQALFHLPQGVAVDASGAVYVADTFNHVVRRIAPLHRDR